jgi:hypothetical protein
LEHEMATASNMEAAAGASPDERRLAAIRRAMSALGELEEDEVSP